MRKSYHYAFGIVGATLQVFALLGMWDLARHQVELERGWYDLPFKIRVPWYIAGDIFVTMGVIAMLIFLLAVLISDPISEIKKLLSTLKPEKDKSRMFGNAAVLFCIVAVVCDISGVILESATLIWLSPFFFTLTLLSVLLIAIQKE